MTHIYVQIRCLRDWPGFGADYRVGQEYKVRDFIANALAKANPPYAEIISAPVVEEPLRTERQERLW